MFTNTKHTSNTLEIVLGLLSDNYLQVCCFSSDTKNGLFFHAVTSWLSNPLAGSTESGPSLWRSGALWDGFGRTTQGTFVYLSDKNPAKDDQENAKFVASQTWYLVSAHHCHLDFFPFQKPGCRSISRCPSRTICPSTIVVSSVCVPWLMHILTTCPTLCPVSWWTWQDTFTTLSPSQRRSKRVCRSSTELIKTSGTSTSSSLLKINFLSWLTFWSRQIITLRSLCGLMNFHRCFLLLYFVDSRHPSGSTKGFLFRHIFCYCCWNTLLIGQSINEKKFRVRT